MFHSELARHVRVMPKTKNPKRRQHFLKEWRKHAGLTLAVAAERASMSESNLSLLENYKIDYTAKSLGALAEVYRCLPADLLAVDPRTSEGDFFASVRRLTPEQMDQLAKIAKTFRD